MQYNELIGFKLNSRVKASLESVAYYPFHLHQGCIEIVCLLNGRATIWDSAQQHELSYGDVYIFNANDPHKIVSEDPSSILLTLHLDKAHYSDFFPDLEPAYFICDTFSLGEEYSLEIRYLRFLLAKLYSQCSAQEPSDLATQETARELLSLLLDQFQHYTYHKNADGVYTIVRRQNIGHDAQQFSRIYRIIDHIAAHFAEKLTLEKLARQEYLSPSHLSRYIKETSGLSFSELLSLTRCEEAERLLSASVLTVDAIASRVGFANRKHLAVQFRRWFGVTPTEYRRSIRADLASGSRISLRPFDYSFALTVLDIYLNNY